MVININCAKLWSRQDIVGYLSEIKQHKMEEHERDLEQYCGVLMFLFPDFSVGR